MGYLFFQVVIILKNLQNSLVLLKNLHYPAFIYLKMWLKCNVNANTQEAQPVATYGDLMLIFY